MENMLVSVIVPVYNVKAYLEKCIDSILLQTYYNLEIIIVDDGSTDGSAEICDAFEKKDQRVSVLHKKNEGVVSARKAGIGCSSGEYILCIDSDDWVERQMIQKLVEIAKHNNADIVTSGLYIESINTQIYMEDSVEDGVYQKYKMKSLYGRIIFNESVEIPGILPNLCTKLVKSSLLKKVHLNMSNNIGIGEDAAAVYSCCTFANVIVVTYNKFYHYVMRNSSAMHTNYHAHFFSEINELYLFMKNNFIKSEYKDLLLKQLEIYFIKLNLWGLNYGFGLNLAIPYYDFSRNLIPIRSEIILYGAGKVGQAYYKQIKRNNTYKLIAWIDQNYQKYQTEGLPVDSVEKIVDYQFDYVVFALKSKKMAEDLKQELIKKYEVEKEKIIWIEPINTIDKFVDWDIFLAEVEA